MGKKYRLLVIFMGILIFVINNFWLTLAFSLYPVVTKQFMILNSAVETVARGIKTLKMNEKTDIFLESSSHHYS